MARRKANPLAGALAHDSQPVRASLTLPAGVLWRLTTVASRLGRDRSEFACELIDAGLARYALDKALRQFTAAEPGGPAAPEEPAA